MMHSTWSQLPRSRVGRIVQWLMVVFAGLFVLNQLSVVFQNDLRGTAIGQIATQMPVAVWMSIGFAMLGVGLAASITSVIAIIRHHERSWVLWLALLPGLFVVFLLVGEFLIAPFD
jgi:hypothetical protein